jgi:hypothetical protein
MKIDDVARAIEDILAVAGSDETVVNEAFEKLQKRVGLGMAAFYSDTPPCQPAKSGQRRFFHRRCGAVLAPATNLKESTRRKLSGSGARVACGDRGSSCSCGGDGICEVGQGGCFRLDRYAFLQPLDREHRSPLNHRHPNGCFRD